MNDLKEISIALLGGSTSGKTTFLGGVVQAFQNRFLEFGDDVFGLIPISINSGIVANDDKNCNVTVVESKDFAENMAEEAAMAAPAFGGNAAPAFGGGVAPAFGGAAPAFTNANTSVKAGNAEKDDEKVDNIKAASGDVHNSTLISAEIQKAWEISPEKGFRPGTATTKYVEVTFKVQINTEDKCILKITDYAGELLDNACNVPEVMLKQLTSYIANSDSCIILANSRAMSSHIRERISNEKCMFVEQATISALSALRINGIIPAMASKNYCLLLAITQCDSPEVDKRMIDDKFARAALDLTRYIYQPAFTTAKNKKWSRGVIPVTAIGRKEDGSPCVDENNELLMNAEINQENIDIAVLFCLYNAILAANDDIKAEWESYKGLSLLKKAVRDHRNILKKQSNDLCDIIKVIMSDKKIYDTIYCRECPLEKQADIGRIV